MGRDFFEVFYGGHYPQGLACALSRRLRPSPGGTTEMSRFDDPNEVPAQKRGRFNLYGIIDDPV